MKDPEIKTAPIDVLPHQDDGKHTDAALTTLYNTILTVANLEATIVWQRYNSILVANSVILAVVNTSTLENHQEVKAALEAIGLLLCAFWGALTEEGWRFWTTYSTMAARFRWPRIDDEVNVFEVMYSRFARGGQTIRIGAVAIILLFVAIYLVLFASTLMTIRK